jgi:pimeloyl-ACP methyl ester carboxylesterase
MKLYYRTEGSPDKPALVILHGLFGSSDNWLTMARSLADDYYVILPDACNHGQSPHSDVFEYPAMAQDVVDLLDSLELESVYLVGHSMGGKTAMHLATEHPDRVKKLVVVDISPRYYRPHHQVILAGLHNLPLDKVKTRRDADKALSLHIDELGVRQFLLKNLDRTDGGYQWRMNLPVITDNIEMVGEGLDEGKVYKGPTLFIDGETSSYIKDSDKPIIKKHFPEAHIVTIKDAGHWVQAEQPEAFRETLVSFLSY